MTEKILIIDDDLDTLKLVGLMLQKHGFQILAASSGTPGLDLALAEHPDLILLDIMMPGMDGYEVARRLRANDKTLDIPIIMFTAKSQLEDKVAGFKAGADDYLTKPTHPTELQAHVNAILSRSSKSKSNPPSKPLEESSAYLIGVIAARGGLGVTTVASNLAAMLENKTGNNVIMAEFRPGQGTLSYDLGIEKMSGLTELLNTPAASISRQLVEEKLITIPNIFKILVSSAQPKEAILAQNVKQFETILKRLEFMAGYVVVDLGSGLTALNQKLVGAFKELILIVEPHENSIQHSLNLLDDLSSLGVDLERVLVAVNFHLRSDIPQLSVAQAKSYFRSVEASFSPAPELYLQAAKRHLVASLIDLESVTAVQYSGFAQRVEARAHKKTA